MCASVVWTGWSFTPPRDGLGATALNMAIVLLTSWSFFFRVKWCELLGTTESTGYSQDTLLFALPPYQRNSGQFVDKETMVS